MIDRAWTMRRGEGPVVATAIHDGHDLREEVARRMELDEDVRLREEDPFTSVWTRVAPSRVVVRRSRFEVDMNRPRDGAVYRRPEDAWGLQVWEGSPPDDMVRRSLELYDAFYGDLRHLLRAVARRHRRFVVYDIHSYNHRRGGGGEPAAEARDNPEINLGTGSMPRARWGPVVEAFMQSMGQGTLDGRGLDVRENVRFRGGELARWVHRTFPGRGCCLAIEVKKFFMDEWTGEPYTDVIRQVGDALQATVRPVEAALRRMETQERLGAPRGAVSPGSSLEPRLRAGRPPAARSRLRHRVVQGRLGRGRGIPRRRR